jgi:predicted enzyme related to lactoylglutathione lyase
MTDPFDVLRAPVTPAQPDPAFAARLRARIERALALPEGVAVTDITVSQAPEPTPADRGTAATASGPGVAGPEAALRQGDIGYASLWVPNVALAAAFYTAVLGVEYLPGHGGGRQAPGLTPPQALWHSDGRPALFCSYVVDDAAAAVEQVRAAGGHAGEPVPQPYGLSADCVDIDGLRFAVYQPSAAQPGVAGSRPAAAGQDGDLIYVTLAVPDADRTLAFYRAVLGWRSRPGRSPGGWQVEGTTPMIGVSGGHAEAAMVPVWRAADVAAAVARVRAAGGASTEPHQEPYGLIAECTDNQGFRFSVTQFPG